MERQSLQVDIACVGFGPATGAFLHTLSKALQDPAKSAKLGSRCMPGMPLQVMCYERADDTGFSVSGVVSKARSIKKSFPEIENFQIPMLHPVTKEKLIYLQDPIGASRRSAALRAADGLSKLVKPFLKGGESAIEIPFIPPFLSKEEGLVFSLGQFNQFMTTQLMTEGQVQVWPGTPVEKALIEEDRVVGIQLVDQGVDKSGKPDGCYAPGMNINAELTVVGDGPVGQIGRQLDSHFGLPPGHHQREWAVGMKMVVELPESCQLEPGTVFHTLGFPEPEIFGFLYIYPDRIASLGIFVPSWFDSPVRTSYKYLQHWMKHPYLWQYLRDASIRSWGAKTLQESGKRGEPYLVGNGYARIGEGSGTTNVLTGSGVDEAWESGVLLAEAVIEILEQEKPFTRENLKQTYLTRRQNSWLEKESKIAEKARDGFQASFMRGMIGMTLTGFSGGRINLGGPSKRPYERIPSLEEYYRGKIDPQEINLIRENCRKNKTSLADQLMQKAGWPEIQNDGKLLVSHQDALLMGGKVQAAGGYADHVIFSDAELCQKCGEKICVEICSGQAISQPEDGGVPQFDREKCIHCGACLWNCSQSSRENPEWGNVDFRAGSGGLHSSEN